MAGFDEVHGPSLKKAVASRDWCTGEIINISLIEPMRIRPHPEPVSTDTVKVISYRCERNGKLEPTKESVPFIEDWKKRHRNTPIDAFRAWLTS